MTRSITVGAAQLGPIQRDEDRVAVVRRLVALMEKGQTRGCQFIVFPELALTTFFPRYYMEDQTEIDEWFETSIPSNSTQPLFDAAKRYGMGFHLGYAEKVEEQGVVHRYNTAILVESSGNVIGKYRKIHLPGPVSYTHLTLPTKRIV